MIQWLANEEATVALGCAFAKQCKGGDTIVLNGDLGAGKTTFVRGFLRAFGYVGNVKSPTYTLVEPYHFDGLSVYHFDLYRLGDAEELEYIGVRDYFNSESICLIEWPEKGRGVIPRASYSVSLAYKDEGRSALIV